MLLFDGACVFCSRWVQFVARHERKSELRFAAQQSAAGIALLASFGLDSKTLDSVALIEHNRILLRSDAALAIASRMCVPYSWLGALNIIPRPMRDFFYGRVARSRYLLAGKLNACPLPEPSLARRILA